MSLFQSKGEIVQLSLQDLKIIASVINFSVYTEFSRSASPDFDEAERAEAAGLIEALIDGIRATRAREAEQPREFQWDGAQRALVRKCFAAFEAEVGHSPLEIEVLTGATSHDVASLVSRIMPHLHA